MGSEVAGSGYTNVDLAEHPRDYVARLDRVGRTPFWQSIKQLTWGLLEVGPGARVLDVGCGIGDDVRGLAREVTPNGQAVGVDASATMIAEARQRSARLDLPVTFDTGDAYQLEFADATFDGCRAERLLQHLDDPRRALREMIRVVRPGGKLVVVEPDYGTLIVDGADPIVTDTILSCRRSHFRSPRIGGELPRLFKSSGLHDLGVIIKRIETTDATTDRERLLKYVTDAVQVGQVTLAQGAAWLADVNAAGATGAYRHAIAVLVVSGRKA